MLYTDTETCFLRAK